MIPYLPDTHLIQVSDDIEPIRPLHDPDSHASHSFNPSLDPNLPLGQNKHEELDEEALKGLYDPTGQLIHRLSPPNPHLPSGHEIHFESCFTYPGVQMEQKSEEFVSDCSVMLPIG